MINNKRLGRIKPIKDIKIPVNNKKLEQFLLHNSGKHFLFTCLASTGKYRSGYRIDIANNKPIFLKGDYIDFVDTPIARGLYE